MKRRLSAVVLAEARRELARAGGRALAAKFADLREKAEAGDADAQAELASLSADRSRCGAMGGRPRKLAPKDREEKS